MSIFTSARSMMLALGVATAVSYAGTAAADGGGSTQSSLGGFQCFNKLDIQVVSCVGSIAVLPINIDIKDVRALNDNELSVLSGDLNHVSILDGGILNNDKILNDVQVTVLQDFLDKFLVNVSNNDVDVCTSVLGAVLCK
jgi:hypothetical protein